MPSIRISPSPVMIPVAAAGDAQRPGSARVTYNADDVTPYLWERTVGTRWRRRPIASSDPSEGSWTVEVTLGTIYQVVMFDVEHADPNANAALDDPPPVARATTYGLRKEVASPLLTDQEFGPTGTSFNWYPNTSVPTYAQMHVGRVEPEMTTDGVHVFAAPLETAFEDFTDRHQLRVASERLLPGNPFFATLLLVAKDGRWMSLAVPFTTWKRTVEVLLKEIRILNDGAPGDNTASFRIWVCEGNTFVSACHLPEREISDRPDPGEEYKEYIGLSAECELPIRFGPSVVTRDTRRVSILTRGIASVTVGRDDRSGNFNPNNGFPANPPTEDQIFDDAFLPFPVGASQETIEEGEFQTFAVPLTKDNEFSYEVNGVYSVTYEPE